MDSSISLEDEIWFLIVCHDISYTLYLLMMSSKPAQNM